MAIWAIRRDVTDTDRRGLAFLGGLESLDDVLTQSDFLVITLPLTPEARGLVGERELALMKPTARLIN